MLWLGWSAPRFDPRHYDNRMRVDDVTARIGAPERRALGPFAPVAMWRLKGADRRFGGYSALVLRRDGMALRAISDRNRTLQIDLPVRTGWQEAAIPRLIVRSIGRGYYLGYDPESAVRDTDGAVWLGLEDAFHVVRADMRTAQARFFPVPELRDWPRNGGAEAMARLNDGRWIMLCESCGGGKGGLHLGLIFSGNPGQAKAQKFGLIMPPGFDPVDAATLPDGRVLILTRRLVLFPLHFEAQIVLADFAALDPKRPLPTQEVARLDGSPIRENWEGMALMPGANPRDLALWLISDANDSAFQETLLLQLRFDPQSLPQSGGPR
ncbi:MAG: hypothetical protein B7Y36_05290 [Novosphingobium sp. 28-62-57]|nr:MAG: hypothetical protein B7Z34_05625 [Novosphingobium sp. 12-62-10]OYZ11564.1 MAG: hypothetical protein B7Y36_05290 [Novosphingobium sp. 28-62-57]OZA36172.1 MAG: hypothetical protein B7X92_07455 [Novosphingobium sp. 17-62-9]